MTDQDNSKTVNVTCHETAKAVNVTGHDISLTHSYMSTIYS